jgi:dCMP deaminase
MRRRAVAHPNIAMNRPSFPEIYMTLARALAGRSTCSVEHVGAVITSVDFRKVLAVGYRGNATGLPNKCDHPNAGADCGCLHAEENAVIHCDAPRSEPKIAFISHLPCYACAKRFIQLGGIQDLYYGDTVSADRTDEKAIVDLLSGVGTRVHRFSDE